MVPMLQNGVHRLLQYAAECAQVMSWADLIDIAIIGALLSIGLVWLKRRTARAILFALVPLLGTLAAAKELKLYMTSVLFQFGLIAVFVSIVVIFQEDFRRAFESLAAWRPWGRTRAIHAGKLADVLVECLTTLAKSKTGALLVLQGRQGIETHIRAGIPLNGTISAPLLFSIFDPHSPGHDGAAVIADGRLASFGVHLPLSRNADATGRLGTRHAAALGLVERCDALVLVVSEETGTTSIARDGRLAPSKSPADTRDAIAKHFRRVGPVAIHRSLWEVPWLRLTASFGLATLMWLVFARPANLILRSMDATIVYRGLPKGWEAKPPDPPKTRITLFGPEGPLMSLDPATMAVSIDLFRVAEGQQRFVLSESGVSLPARIRIKRFEPAEILVQAYPVVDIELPISVNWLDQGTSRTPQSGAILIDPARVTVKVPRAIASKPHAIETEAVDMRELQKKGRVRAKLRVPAEAPAAELSSSEVDIVLPEPVEMR